MIPIFLVHQASRTVLAYSGIKPRYYVKKAIVLCLRKQRTPAPLFCHLSVTTVWKKKYGSVDRRFDLLAIKSYNSMWLGLQYNVVRCANMDDRKVCVLSYLRLLYDWEIAAPFCLPLIAPLLKFRRESVNNTQKNCISDKLQRVSETSRGWLLLGKVYDEVYVKIPKNSRNHDFTNQAPIIYRGNEKLRWYRYKGPISIHLWINI